MNQVCFKFKKKLFPIPPETTPLFDFLFFPGFGFKHMLLKEQQIVKCTWNPL